MDKEKSAAEPTQDMVKNHMQQVEEAKQMVANNETVVVAVPQGELLEVAGVPFTVGKVKAKSLTLIPIRGYSLMKETTAQRLERLKQGEST